MVLECEKCKSKDVAKKGFRYNQTGKKQKYHCNDCDSWFVPDDGFKKMRHLPKDVVRAIHLHDDGVKVTRWTIAEWHHKFGVFLKSAKRASHANHRRKGSL